jgi:hypothetical protein
VKPAKDGLSGDLTARPDRPMARRIFIQRQMRSELVVIGSVGSKDPAQATFAEDDDVIEAFPADRADQPFHMPILPGRPWSGRVIADAHGGETSGNGMTIRSVSVPDEMVRYIVPREGIGDLVGDPFCRRMGRHAERYQPTTLVPENDQNEEQLEADRWHDQKIHGGDAHCMVAEKGLPRLRSPSPTLRHVFGNG